MFLSVCRMGTIACHRSSFTRCSPPPMNAGSFIMQDISPFVYQLSGLSRYANLRMCLVCFVVASKDGRRQDTLVRGITLLQHPDLFANMSVFYLLRLLRLAPLLSCPCKAFSSAWTLPPGRDVFWRTNNNKPRQQKASCQCGWSITRLSPLAFKVH